MLRSMNVLRSGFAKMTVREAINSAMAQEIERDSNVFLIGEEVGQFQGAYKVSKGLYDKFGASRIWDTPITEAGFTGLSVGAAMYGLKPIVEFMTFNFAMQAIDHVINSSAKLHYMSAGDLRTSIVFRGINGAAASVAAQHSQCFAAWYSQVPGLIVLAPYDCEDARGLLKTAIRNPNPVVFLENEIMYNEGFEVPDPVMDKDFLIPVGKAKIMKEGKDVTIVTFSKMVKFSMLAAKELEREGISCEVINLRTLKPIDRQTIIDSVKKTNKIVTVEEGWGQCGIGAEVSSILMECKDECYKLADAFFHLDRPLVRVTGVDVPTPYAFNLEEISFPKTHNIVEAVKLVLK